MEVANCRKTSVLSASAVLPVSSDDDRASYMFDERIAAMEKRMRESGVPNTVFPFVGSLCVANPTWNSLHEDLNSYDAVCVLKGLRPVALLPLQYCQPNDALGYPANAIQRFVDSLAVGQLGAEVAIMVTVFPAEEESSLKIRLPSGRAVVLR
jgi:hypothetical protein